MTIAETTKTTSFGVFQAAMELVLSSDNAQDLCRKLVHSDLLSGIVRGAFLYSLNNRSNLIETAGYGEPFPDSTAEISVWHEHPISNAIRAKRDVFTPGDHKKSLAAIVSLPLIRDTIPTGVLVLVLAPDAEESPIPSDVAPAIGKLGAYFLDVRGFVAKSGSAPSGRESIEELTTRQITILGLMGDG